MAPLFHRHDKHDDKHDGDRLDRVEAFLPYRHAGLEVLELADDLAFERERHVVDHPGIAEPIGTQYARAHAWTARLCQRMADCIVAVAESGSALLPDTDTLLQALYAAVPRHLVRARGSLGVADPPADTALPSTLPWPNIDPTPLTSIGLYEALTRAVVDFRAEIESAEQIRQGIAPSDAWRLTCGEAAAAEDAAEYALRIFNGTENRSVQRKSHWVLVDAFDHIARAGQFLACPSLARRDDAVQVRAGAFESEDDPVAVAKPEPMPLASGAWNFTDPSVVDDIRHDEHRSNQLQQDYLEDLDPHESMRLLLSLQTWEQQDHIERSGVTPHAASPWSTVWRANCHLRVQAHTIAPGAVFTVAWQRANPTQPGTHLCVILPTQRLSAEPDVPPEPILRRNRQQ